MKPSLMQQRSFAPRQRGIALFVALVILLVITLAGVFGMQSTRMEERMAANARDHDIAFQAAEAALSAGEIFVQGDDDLGVPGVKAADLDAFDNNVDGLYVPAAPNQAPRWEQVDIAEDGKSIEDVTDPIDGLDEAMQPRFIVEHVAEVTGAGDDLVLTNIGEEAGGPTDVFRVTSVATGASGNARVMLQTTYGKKIQ